MNEQQWLTSTDPQQVLEFLRISGRVSERKLRLFAVACLRAIWHALTERRQQVVSATERHADGLTGPGTVAPSEGGDVIGVTLPQLAARLAVECLVDGRWEGAASLCARAISEGGIDSAAKAAETNRQAMLLRDIFGNPFQPALTIDASLLHRNSGAVPQLARSAYEERSLPEGHLDTGRLAVLADALEEAGCTDPELLTHLRGPGPHVRGCWALDAVLGRS